MFGILLMLLQEEEISQKQTNQPKIPPPTPLPTPTPFRPPPAQLQSSPQLRLDSECLGSAG